MANKKISELPAATTPLSGSEKIEIVQGGINKQADASDLGGGSVSDWGDIGGTLSNQTDLQTALNLKANLASPALTGNPTAPTQSGGDNSTKLATTAYVDAAALGVVSSWKTAARIATTTAGTLASDFENGDTIDGVVITT